MPSPEVCDGLDNNCSNGIDDMLTAPPCALQQGICTGTVKTCGGTSGWLDCNGANYGPSYQAVETLCDGLDNNCDGYVDNGPGCVSTSAGMGAPGYSNGPLMDARFDTPLRPLFLSGGDVLVPDSQNHVIRRLNLTTGQVTLEAGTLGSCGREDGPPGSGQLCDPFALAEGEDGTIYVADHHNNVVRTLNAGVLGVAIGTFEGGNMDGPALSATMSGPHDVRWLNGTLYFVDGHNCRVRKLVGGMVSTVAGTVCGGAVDGALGTEVFGYIYDIDFDPTGTTMFIADTGNHRIRTFTLATGVTATLAGSEAGFRNGAGAQAQFHEPHGMAWTPNGLVTADLYNHRLRRIELPSGNVSTLLGSGTPGLRDGTVALARVAEPRTVAFHQGEVWFTANAEHRLRKVTATNDVVTVAGGASLQHADGDRQSATVFWPQGITQDPSTGIAYFTERDSGFIRALHPDGSITTVAGGQVLGFLDGPLLSALFNRPNGLHFHQGSLYVADGGNHVLRRVDLGTGLVSTVAGAPGDCDYLDGAAMDSLLCWVQDVAVASDGTVYFTEYGHVVRQLKNGVVTTLAGQADNAGYLDGVGTAAILDFPRGIEVGPDGLVYFVEGSNHTVRTVDPMTLAVTTLIGPGCDDINGTARNGAMPGAARICSPTDLIFSGTDLYITSSGMDRIKRLSGNTVSTAAGIRWADSYADGPVLQARFGDPAAMANAPGGGFYVTDVSNHRIRRLMP